MSAPSQPGATEALLEAITPGATVIVLSVDAAAVVCPAAEAAGPEGEIVVVVEEPAACDAVAAAAGDLPAGAAPVSVHRGAWADLRLDVVAFEAWLDAHPPRTLAGIEAADAERRQLAAGSPVVADDAADVVFADRILRAVAPERRRAAIAELYRVQKVAGTLVLSDIVADEPLPPRLLGDADVPASMQESELLGALEDAKFIGAEILGLPEEPIGSAEAIEFRPILIRATKGKEGMCVERMQAVVYLGPWRVVEDDDGHVIRRGQRLAVCDKTYHVYQRSPYAGQFAYLDPVVEIPREEAKPWDVRHPPERSPAETKGLVSGVQTAPAGSPAEGIGYVIRAEWLDRDGTVLRRARLTHRYRGYFETAEEGLEMARTVFEDATRFTPMEEPLAESLARLQRSGKTVACPLPEPGHSD